MSSQASQQIDVHKTVFTSHKCKDDKTLYEKMAQYKTGLKQNVPWSACKPTSMYNTIIQIMCVG